MRVIEATSWPGLRMMRPLGGGNRSEVWLGDLSGSAVAIRRSQRSPDSLRWELDLLSHLSSRGFLVPEVIEASDGRWSVDGVTVHRWLDGREPSSDGDWRRVADELQRLHRELAGHPQRPGCVTIRELATARRSVDADLDAMPPQAVGRVLAAFAAVPEDVPASVIHGDPGPGNIRLSDDGRVGLLDWDESRVDVTWHDLSNLGVQVLGDEDHRLALQLSDAWEAINAWIAEPTYARRRLGNLSARP